MHECNAMQILKTKRNKTSRKEVTKDFEMKHKDHVKKTQVDWAFCIQNFLDVTLVLELLFILELWVTPALV